MLNIEEEIENIHKSLTLIKDENEYLKSHRTTYTIGLSSLPEELSILFEMNWLHDNAYESYFLIMTWINKCLEKDIKTLESELENKYSEKNNIQSKLIIFEELKQTYSGNKTLKEYRQIKSNYCEYKNKLEEIDNNIQKIKNNINDKQKGINTKIYNKNEAFLPEELRALYNSWCNLYSSEIKFLNELNGNKEQKNIEDIEKEIESIKKEMSLFIES